LIIDEASVYIGELVGEKTSDFDNISAGHIVNRPGSDLTF